MNESTQTQTDQQKYVAVIEGCFAKRDDYMKVEVPLKARDYESALEECKKEVAEFNGTPTNKGNIVYITNSTVKPVEEKTETPEERNKRIRKAFLDMGYKIGQVQKQRDDLFNFIQSLKEDLEQNRPINGRMKEFLDDRAKDIQGLDFGIDNDPEFKELQRDCENENFINSLPF